MTILLAAALALAIDTDGMLLVNGQRTFMVGLYDFPKVSNPWQTSHDAGFNLVHVKPTVADLQLAAKFGFYAWTGAGKSTRQTVEALRDEPALILWEIEDEPTFVWKKPFEIRTPPERIIATRKLIQSLDPKRLFYLNHSPTNLVSTLRRYNEGTDVVATDVYPVIPRGIRSQYALWPDGQQGDLLNETVSQVGQYTDKMRQVAGPGKPVFMVLQGFAWESTQKQPDPKMLLYPTREQARFMAYQAIVHGANGILYWGLHLGPENNPGWHAASAVASELKQIATELAARASGPSITTEYFETGHSLDKGIASLLKSTRNGVLLIAVNEDKNPVDVVFGQLSGFKTCSVKFEQRTVAFNNGALRDTFAPFTARVYHCTR